MTGEEAELASQVQELLRRIGDLRGSVMSVGAVVALAMVLAATFADLVIGGDWLGKILIAFGNPHPFLAAVVGFLIPAGGIGAILAWVLYGKRKRRLLEVELARLAADRRVPRLFEKLAGMYAAHLRLSHQFRTSEEFFSPHPAIVRYIREYFGPLKGGPKRGYPNGVPAGAPFSSWRVFSTLLI